MEVSLVLLKKNGTQKTFSLPSSITVIGRRRDCDLRIPVASVSRRHCQLSCNESALTIRDLRSRNGTIVNNKRVSEATIQAGDLVKIGPLTFALQIGGRPATIAWPGPAEQKQAKHNAPAKETADIQFTTFTEPDAPDTSLNEDSALLDDLDSLDDDDLLTDELDLPENKS